MAITVVALAMLGLPAAANADTIQWASSYQLTGTGWGSGVDCPTSSLCLTTAEVSTSGTLEDDVMWTSDPATGASSWHYVTLEPAQQASSGATYEPLSGVSCSVSGTTIVDCALVDGFGNVWQTSNPTGSASAWLMTEPGEYGFEGASCWSTYCGEIDSGGNGLVTDGATPVSDQNLFSGGPFAASSLDISCAGATLCVADEIDQGPSLAWTASPASATPDWQTGSLTGVDNLGQVACPTASLCVADENEGEGTPSVGVSTNPTGGASAWTSSTVPGATAGLDSAACASASLCVLGGYEKTFTSTDPTGGSSTWDESTAPFQSFIGSISCPSATECVAFQNGQISVGTVTAGGSPGGGGVGGGVGGGTAGSGTAAAGHPSVSGATMGVSVSCTGTSGATCIVAGELSATETSRGGTVIAVTARKRTKKAKTTRMLVVLGKAAATIAAGHSATLEISLSGAGKRLLAKLHRLPAKLTVVHRVGTSTSVATVATDTVTFKSAATKKHK